MSSEDAFADRIYEASIVPELWPQVLREFAALADAREAAVIATRGEEFRWVTSSPEADELARRTYAYPLGAERTRRLLAARHAGFLTELDVFEPDVFDDPMFAEYLIPAGYGRGVATAVSSPSGDMIVLHAEGDHAKGPVDRRTIARLDTLRPHLARGALLSARLGLEQARAAAAALEAVGLPAAVLGRGGRTLAANALLEAMMPQVAQDRPARLGLADAGADALLATAVEALGRAEAGATVRSIPIPAREEHPPVIVHLVPVRGVAHDFFSAATAILLATPVVPRQVPGATVLQALFDLTPAEARVAQAVGDGGTAAEIAAAGGVSLATVRNQIAAVLAKSGLRRQAELVGLLAGQTLPAGR